MTTKPVPQDSDDSLLEGTAPAEEAVASQPHTGSPDPITGEPDAHPIGVGVGAIAAGAAGAAVGAFAGPVGVIIGAAIGAIAGGLAGKGAAETPEISPVSNEIPLDEFDRPNVEASEEPLPASIVERVTPHEDAFITGGTLSGRDPDAFADSPLDEFDRPRDSVIAYPDRRSDLLEKYGSEDDEAPLPTASGGLVTPEETSIFADSTVTGDRTTGESGFLTESPLTAAHAVDPGDRFADTPASATASGSFAEVPATSDEQTFASSGGLDTEDTIRANAYYRYLDREVRSESGSDFDDWIAAEKEIGHR